jgi:TP901 family phage tail tape measure protein
MATAAVLSVKITGNISDLEKSLQSTERSFQRTGSKLQSFGTNLTKAFSVPLGAIGGFAIKAAVDFESSFAGIKKTTNATEAEFAALAQGMRDLAKSMPVNVNELNKIGEAAGQLGIPKETLLDFTRVMAQLGATTNLTSDQAATSIAQIQNIFNASGQNTENFASALVALGNAGASTEQDIVAMAARLAGAANQIGLTQAETLGFAAALANLGINAEAGGTALSRVMSKISVAVDTGGAKLNAFASVAGLSATQFAKLFKSDPAEAIARFVDGLAKVKDTGGNVTSVLEDLSLKDIRVQDALKRMSGAGDQLRTSLTLARDAWVQNSALTQEFGKRAETTESQLIILWNRVRDVAITLGTALLPTLRAVVAQSSGVVDFAAKAADAFSNLPVGLQETALALGAIAVAAGPLVYVAGALISAWGSVAGVLNLSGVGAALSEMFSGIAYVIAGFEGLIPTTTGAVGGLSGAFEALAIVVGGPVAAGLTVAAGVLAAVGAAIVSVIGVTLGWDKAWQFVKDSIMIVVDALKIVAVAIADVVVWVGERLFGALKKASNYLLTWIPTSMITTLNWFVEKIHKLRGVLDEFANRPEKLTADIGLVAPAGEFVGPQLPTGPSVGPNQPGAPDLNADAEAAKKYAKELENLRQQFSGADVLKSAKQYEEILTAIGGASHLTQEEQKKFAAVFDDVIEKYKTFGKDAKAESVVAHFQALAQTVPLASRQLTGFKGALATGLAPSVDLTDVQRSPLESTAGPGIGLSYSTTLPKVIPDSTGALKEFRAEEEQARQKALALKDVWANMGDTIVSSLTGGGGIGGAIKGIASQFGSVFSKDWGKSIATNIGGKLGSFLGELVGPLGSLLGPALGAIGSLIGKGLGKLFHTEEKKVNDMRDSFQGTFGSLHDMDVAFHNVGLTVDKVLNAKKVEDFNAAMKEFNDALAFQNQSLDTLKQTAEKYGFTIEELGPALQRQQLSEQAGQIYQDFKVLQAGGIDVATITKRMSENVNEFVANAIKTGAEIPAAMKPILQQFIDQGLLLDANGNKITSLEGSGITFSETMSEGFTRVVDSVKLLTEAIARGLGIALSDLPGQAAAAANGVNNAVGGINPPDNFFPRGSEPTPSPGVPKGIAPGEPVPGGYSPGPVYKKLLDDQNALLGFAARGAMVGTTGLKYFARGRVLPFRQRRGRDSLLAAVSPDELIINAAQQKNVAAEMSGGDTYHIDARGAMFDERGIDYLLRKLRERMTGREQTEWQAAVGGRGGRR